MKEQTNYWEKKNIWNLSAFLKNKFLRICPYGKQNLANVVRACKRDMLLVSVLAVFVILLWNNMFKSFSGVYVAESIALALYLVCMEVPNFRFQEKENMVYRELLMYFSRVKHRYRAGHHMANAVLDAADNMPYEIQRLAGELYRVLMESDRKEKIREYILHNRTNRYLKLFLIQAYEVSEKGDLYFEENVEQLRLELMEEIYRRKRRNHEFSGYVFVTVAPFFLMPVLRQWGLEFMPELEFFYAGTGVLLETITFVITVVIYGMILRAKEITFFHDTDEEKLWNFKGIYDYRVVASIIRCLERRNGELSNKIRQLILRSGERTSYGKLCFQIMVLFTGTFFLFSCFCIETHGRERKTILERVDSMETIAPVFTEEKRSILEEHILVVTKECIGAPDSSEEEIQRLLRSRVRLENENTEQEAVKEIKEKLMQYKAAKVSLVELVFCFLGSVGIGLIPLIRLLYQTQTIRAGAVYEIRQFQSIILMERKLQGVTIAGLLEDMEVFSQCFRGVLRRCINLYNASPERALLRLKEEGSKLHDGFEELADAFLSVDEVGVELAFAEVENNRRLLEKMTQLEAEINMERKKDNTDLIAKIPMILTIGAYFILPFFTYSLQGVYEVFKLLEEMQI